MNYCEHVAKAQAGSTRDFAELVELFQNRLDSYLRRWISSVPDREEVLMDCFLVTWQRLGQLKIPEAFPSWLWAIGRTQAWKRLRKADPRLVFGLDTENLATEPEAETGDAREIARLWETWSLTGTWNRVLGALSQGQREVVELHHLAGFDYRETALICQTTEARVKSRLHEARLSIRRLAPLFQSEPDDDGRVRHSRRSGVTSRSDTDGAAVTRGRPGESSVSGGITVPGIGKRSGPDSRTSLSDPTGLPGKGRKARSPRRGHASPENTLKEIIMTRIDTLKLGAHVFERLGLNDQTSFATSVLSGTAFEPELLATLGKTDRGREFLALYGGSLGMKELVGILNHCDRFTEGRLIRHLEAAMPEKAEAIKHQLFVFEDFVLCDPAALRIVFAQVEAPVLLTALAGTTPDLRVHLLGGLDKETARDLTARLVEADASLQAVRLAQEELIAAISDLVETGRLRVSRQDGQPGAAVSIHPV